ncbi:MAG: trypsin-like peptidase domain-containing protein [Thalassospira sp.]|nr:trypsin-like peptidase domain-containing protein [Thalassospira sp.]
MSTNDSTIPEAVLKAQNSIVRITDSKGYIQGSGVIVSAQNGTYIITNDHVVKSNGTVTVGMPDGKTLTGTVLPERLNKNDDLALIRVDSSGYENNVATLQTRGVDPAVGSQIIAMGYTDSKGSLLIKPTTVLTNEDIVLRDSEKTPEGERIELNIALSFLAPGYALSTNMSGGGAFAIDEQGNAVLVGVNVTHPKYWGRRDSGDPLQKLAKENSGFIDPDKVVELMAKAGVRLKEQADVSSTVSDRRDSTQQTVIAQTPPQTGQPIQPGVATFEPDASGNQNPPTSIFNRNNDSTVPTTPRTAVQPSSVPVPNTTRQTNPTTSIFAQPTAPASTTVAQQAVPAEQPTDATPAYEYKPLNSILTKLPDGSFKLNLNDTDYKPKPPQYDVPPNPYAKAPAFQRVRYDPSTGTLNSDPVYDLRKKEAQAQIEEKNRAEALQLGTDAIPPTETPDQPDSTTATPEPTSAEPSSPVTLRGAPQESESADAAAVSGENVDSEPVDNTRVAANSDFLRGAMLNSGRSALSAAASSLNVDTSEPITAQQPQQPQQLQPVYNGLNPEAVYAEPPATAKEERFGMEPESASYVEPKPEVNASIGGVFPDSAPSYQGASLASSLAMMGWTDDNDMGSQSVSYGSGNDTDYNSNSYLTA